MDRLIKYAIVIEGRLTAAAILCCNEGSGPITNGKQDQAWSAPRWVIAW